MTKENLGTNVVTQVAIVVKDMDKAIDAWSRILGLPKPTPRQTNPETANIKYRGEPSMASAKLAFYDLGQVSLELIEPDGTPSVWQEVLDQKGYAVHHIAFKIKDTDAVTDFLAENDIPIVQQGQYTGGMYTYVESEPVLGVMLELLENFD